MQHQIKITIEERQENGEWRIITKSLDSSLININFLCRQFKIKRSTLESRLRDGLGFYKALTEPLKENFFLRNKKPKE